MATKDEEKSTKKAVLNPKKKGPIKKMKRLVKKILKAIFVKQLYVYKDLPIFTVKQICKIIKIKVPKKYKEIKNAPVHKTILFSTLEDRDKIISNIKVGYLSKIPKLDRLRFHMTRFLDVYEEQKNSVDKDLDIVQMMVEWLYVFKPEGFYYYDYFDYQLYNKTKKEASLFMSRKYWYRVYKASNKFKAIQILKDKSEFNTVYKKYVNRKFFNMDNTSYEEFEAFVKKTPTFFAKPIEGTGGWDAGIIDSKDYKSIRDLYNHCKKNRLIVEEVVKQHKDLAKYNPSTLNTMRVFSLHCADDKVRVMAACFRTGRKGQDVDNYHCGGSVCVIDVKTGTVISDAANIYHEIVDRHPDSNLKFKGFIIPCWDKIVTAVEESGKLVPGLRHIGWDITVTDKGEVEFIEGNSMPNFDLIQVPDQTGKLYVYEKYIDELEALKEKKKKKKEKKMA